MRTYYIPFVALTVLLGTCDTGFDESDLYDYSVDQQMGCFCPQAGVWVRLFVRADTIAHATNISTGSHLANQQLSPYRTVKGLFDEIAMIDKSMFDVVVVMDSTYNYPSYVHCSPKPIVHGDTVVVVAVAQWSYSTRNFVRLGQ